MFETNGTLFKPGGRAVLQFNETVPCNANLMWIKANATIFHQTLKKSFFCWWYTNMMLLHEVNIHPVWRIVNLLTKHNCRFRCVFQAMNYLWYPLYEIQCVRYDNYSHQMLKWINNFHTYTVVLVFLLIHILFF